MKILAIRGRNLASLAGDFEVDFQQEPLYSAGLFAITGATGAGKSTLLDALCLALYNRTPRLEKVSNQSGVLADIEGQHIGIHETKNILRRGCTEGFAEVDFVGVDNQSYRAKWSVRRAHNKQTGALQNETMSLQALADSQSLGHKKTEVLAEIEKKIGLSFAEFNRAVLLAQNEFFAFLKANDNERAALLEALTGTEYFSQLSRKAFERAREEKDKLTALQQQLQQKLPLAVEQRQQLEQMIHEFAQQNQEDEQQLLTLQQQAQWHQRQQQLQQQRLFAEQELNKLKQQWQHSEAQWQLIKQVQAALPIKPIWTQWQNQQQNQQQRQQALSQLNTQVQQQQQQVQQLLISYQQSQQQHQQLEQQWQDDQPRLNQAKQIDFELIEALKNLEQNKKRLEQHGQQLKQQQNYQQIEQWPQIQQLLSSAKQQHDMVLAQEAHRLIEQVKEQYKQQLAQLEQQVSHVQQQSLIEQQQHLNQQQALFAVALKDWQQYVDYQQQSQQLWQEQQQLLQDVAQGQQQQTHLQQQLPLLKAQLTQAQKAWQDAKLACSQNIQQLREQLEENKPCPVCGSQAHPYQQHEAQTQLNQVLLVLEKQVKQCQDHYDEQRLMLTRVEETLRNHQQRLVQLQSQLNQLTTLQTQSEQSLASLNQFKPWPQLATEKKQSWLQHQQQQVAKQLQHIGQEISQQQQLQQQKEQHHQAIEACLIMEQCTSSLVSFCQSYHQLAQLQTQYQQLLAGQNSQAFEQAWQQKLKNSQLHKESLQTQWQTAQQEIEKAQHSMSLQQQELAKLQEHLALLQQDFEHTFALFTQQYAMDKASLVKLFAYDQTWLQQQQHTLTALQQQLTQAQHQFEAREQDYQQHQQHSFAQTSFAAVNEQLQHTQQRVRQQQQNLGAYQEQLKQDNQRVKQQQQLGTLLQEQQQQVEIWAQLNDVIGSSTGQKFRNAAQQMTLDVLLFYTNGHLKDLARRYRLERVKQSLALQVIDQDMGDEIRSVHSLSGGESFLVSLALALGLASLSSQRVKVESLFIDEGFGSLDADTLRVAMDALDILQSQGRKVGVISHVAEMTERIPSQIQLTKGVAGKSKLEIFPKIFE